MKAFYSFIEGAALILALLASMVLGAVIIMESDKEAAKVGHIEIGQKLYRLVPAEAKAIEQEQNCCIK